MTLTRRRMLQSGVLGAAGLGTASGASALPARRHPIPSRPDYPATLQLASREFVIPGETINEKLDNMERWGFSAIELDGAGLGPRVAEIKNALRGRDISVGAVCAGYDGVLVHENPDMRHLTKVSIMELISSMAELQPVGLIVVPAFVGQSLLYLQSAREALLNDLPELGEHAWANGTRVLIEPLNRAETWYIRQLADAAALCNEIDLPGVAMMGDFYHMGIEEPCDYAAFLSARKHLRNVHLASRQRLLPGQDDRDFRPGFRALKEIGYTYYCSLECFPQGDLSVEIPKSVEFIRRQWEEA